MKKSNFLFETSTDSALKRRDFQESLQVIQRALCDQSFRQLWQEKYFLNLPTLRNLIVYPKGSLGFEYAAHILQNNLSPAFFSVVTPETPTEYFSILSKQTHDLWHVVTGYSTNLEGRTALHSFYTAQTGSAHAANLVAQGISQIASKDALEVQSLFRKISQAYERGSKSKFLLGVRWENYLEMSLNRVRAEVGL